MQESARAKVRVRLNRISGQVTGIQRMIDDDKYCIDVLNQIAAVRSALDSLGTLLLTSHIETCVLGHGTDTAHEQARPLNREDLVSEVRTVLAHFLK